VHLLRDSIPASQLAFWNFAILSNELATPFILHCPSDEHTTVALDFAKFGATNISYFANLDADEDFSQMILSGDDNLMVNGTPVVPGILSVSNNAMVDWSAERHRLVGNVSLADGSVQQVITNALRNLLQQSGTSSIRFVIP
jgi:hypothetical protein